jgi:tRNA dimethylallyltransferase
LKIHPEKTLIVICGSTATGKTDIAIAVAKHFNTEIVSADSRQLFRETNVGTAKPSAQQLKEVPHHFINSHSIHDAMNTGIYEDACIALLDNLFAKHNTVVIAGGTGLYINAVLNGIDNLPTSDANVRNELQRTFNEKGITALQEQLKKSDPVTFSNIDLQNPNRVMRALEVCLVTGKPFSSFLHRKKTERNFKSIVIGIEKNRSELYNGINQRVDKMMEDGLVKEAEELFPLRHLNALQTVGYKELFDYFENKISLPEAIEKIKQHTRNYAKRQLTWFKKTEGIVWLKNEAEVISFLKSFKLVV